MLTPRTIEVLVRYLYSKLAHETEKHYKRKSIWVLPMREIERFKNSVLKRLNHEPYIYDPASGF